MSRRRASDQAVPAGCGPVPARSPHRLQRWFDGHTLPVQWAVLVLLATTLVALLLAALAYWPGGIAAGPAALPAGLPTTGPRLGPQLWAAGLTGMACALAGTWLARRSSQALRDITTHSRLLRRDDAPTDANLPLHTGSAEWQLASQALRRLVDAARTQRLALQARTVQLGEQLHQRSHELSTLQDLSHGLAASSDLFGLVDEALKALEQTLDYSSASVWARDKRGGGASPASPDQRPVVLTGYRSSDTATPEAAGNPAQPLLGKRLSRTNLQRYAQIERERGPLIDNDARQGLLSWLWEKVSDDAGTSALYRGTRSWMGLPLQFRDEVLAVMRVDHHSPGYFNPERVRLLGAVCSQTALALHHAQLLLQERTLAVAAERNRIARDLHDAVSQTLFASNVIAGTLARGVLRTPPLDGPRLAAQAQQLERLNRGALAEMRMLLYELQPEALDNQPLAALLHHPIESLACRGDLQLDTQLVPDDTLAPAVRVQLYRIAQEALSNVARHSGAARVSVLWQPDADGGAWLHIQDDGQGFDAALGRPGHFGLANMHSRAQEIGATLVLQSAPGQGTTVSVRCMPPGAPSVQAAQPAPT